MAGALGSSDLPRGQRRVLEGRGLGSSTCCSSPGCPTLTSPRAWRWLLDGALPAANGADEGGGRSPHPRMSSSWLSGAEVCGSQTALVCQATAACDR